MPRKSPHLLDRLVRTAGPRALRLDVHCWQGNHNRGASCPSNRGVASKSNSAYNGYFHSTVNWKSPEEGDALNDQDETSDDLQELGNSDAAVSVSYDHSPDRNPCPYRKRPRKTETDRARDPRRPRNLRQEGLNNVVRPAPAHRSSTWVSSHGCPSRSPRLIGRTFYGAEGMNGVAPSTLTGSRRVQTPDHEVMQHRVSRAEDPDLGAPKGSLHQANQVRVAAVSAPR